MPRSMAFDNIEPGRDLLRRRCCMYSTQVAMEGTVSTERGLPGPPALQAGRAFSGALRVIVDID